MTKDGLLGFCVLKVVSRTNWRETYLDRQAQAQEEDTRSASNPHGLYVLCPLSAISTAGLSSYKAAEERQHTKLKEGSHGSFNECVRGYFKCVCICADIPSDTVISNLLWRTQEAIDILGGERQLFSRFKGENSDFFILLHFGWITAHHSLLNAVSFPCIFWVFSKIEDRALIQCVR